MTNKKKIVGTLSLGLVVVLAIAGTLAYLTAVAIPKTNAFTFVKGEDVTIDIVENFNDEAASNLVPSAVIQKEVQLENTSTVTGNMDVWGAIRVTWTDGTGTPKVFTDEEFANLITANGIGHDTVKVASWDEEAVAGVGASKIYYYKTIIPKNTLTDQLFSEVTIPKTLHNQKITELVAKDGFKIQIEGAAIQAEGVTLPDAKTVLQSLFPTITPGNNF